LTVISGGGCFTGIDTYACYRREGTIIETGYAAHVSNGISAAHWLSELAGATNGCTLSDLGLPCGGKNGFVDCTVDR
jgi:hypothetical protein